MSEKNENKELSNREREALERKRVEVELQSDEILFRALVVRRRFEAFTLAGFSDEQAFELVKAKV